MNNRKWLLAGYLALLPLWAGANTLEALARDLHLDPARISVSGLSSGAFMANQLHVAHSARLMGAAIIAGGPYRCAAGHYPGSWPGLPGLYTATVVCSRTAPGANLVPAPAPDVAFSVEETRRLAREELIDDPAHLAGSRVWLFSGTRDRTVPTAIVDTLEQYYRTFVPAGAIERLRDLPAGHAMITANYGNACVLSAPPYLNDCDFDAAASLLSQLYGPLQPKGDMDADALFTFRQDDFFSARNNQVSMHRHAHVYLPAACRRGEACGLHIALHGCSQSEDFIGDAFYGHAGYNEWAETNHLAILYPQAKASGWWKNPQGCWDWWGYSGEDYATRNGRQIRAIMRMVDTLLGREPAE